LNTDKKPFYLIVTLLALGTVVIYWPVAGFDFINFDDDIYVYRNSFINGGFSGRAFA